MSVPGVGGGVSSGARELGDEHGDVSRHPMRPDIGADDRRPGDRRAGDRRVWGGGVGFGGGEAGSELPGQRGEAGGQLGDRGGVGVGVVGVLAGANQFALVAAAFEIEVVTVAVETIKGVFETVDREIGPYVRTYRS